MVDAQNAEDPKYTPMTPAYDGPAFRAACELALEGARQPFGYTEPVLTGIDSNGRRSNREVSPTAPLMATVSTSIRPRRL